MLKQVHDVYSECSSAPSEGFLFEGVNVMESKDEIIRCIQKKQQKTSKY